VRRDRTGELLADDVAPVPAITDEHRCTDGWTGHDDDGRPTPCPRCRPHLRRTSRLTVVPPSAATLTMTEKDWQRMVCDLAGWRGWRWHHQHYSKRSPAGWPDLVLVRGPRLIAAELKSERGRVRPEQRVWLDALAAVPGAETFLWRPSAWAQVQAVLQ
jgi:hypothetical protein